MNAAAGTAFKGSEEQRGASGGLQSERLADVLAVGGRVLGGGELQDKDIVWLHQLLLHTRRSNEDVSPIADGCLGQSSQPGVLVRIPKCDRRLPRHQCQ